MEIKNRKTDALLPLIISLVLVAGILIGIKFGNAKTGASSNNNRGLLFYAASNKMSQALDLIASSYVDSLSVNVLEEDAIAGMLKNLDPHSRYIPASDLIAENEPIEGNFSGIGVSFNIMNDTVVIINTVVKGPSEKAGIMPGDRIIRVNDSLIAGVKILSGGVERLLKGKTGTKVKVGILRKNPTGLIDFIITRNKIPLLSIDAAYMLTPDIGYVKVNKFSKTTLHEFTEAGNLLKSQGMQKMIVDLRENGGGLIDAATGMSELFLFPGKSIVYTEGNERSRTDYYANSKNKQFMNLDLVLLINEGSASASEIVAGAIQDNDRGTIIGRRSFGKGLVQEQHLLSDGSAIRLTVARYYTPTGRCIQKPYDHDEGKYFNEVSDRYEHGEMIREDSIHFNDSLMYLTPGGKVVYGGGGIMPDIFVPMDTSDYSRYYKQIMRKGLIYRFAFDYTDKHRKELNTNHDYIALELYLRKKNILREFTVFASKRDITRNEKDLQISGPVIENTVIAYIARNMFDNKGFYPILNKKDKMVMKAVEQLQ